MADLTDLIANALAPWCTGEHRDQPPVPGSKACERDVNRALEVLIALDEAGYRIVPKSAPAASDDRSGT